MQTLQTVQVFYAPRLDVEALSDALLQVATTFLQWKRSNSSKASANSASKEHRRNVGEFTDDVITQDELLEVVLENGIKQAAAGKRVSGDIVYLLEQVQTGPPRREAIDLLEELQHNVLHLLRDTEAVSDRLSEVRLALRTIENRGKGSGDLAGQNTEVEQRAEEGSPKRWAAFIQTVGEVWLRVRRLPPIALAMFEVKMAHRWLVRSTTKDHTFSQQEARKSEDVDFDRLKQQVVKADKAVGQQLYFWLLLNNTINSALLHPERLLGSGFGPSLYLVKRHCDAWEAIQEAFEEYGSRTRAALEILQVA